MTKARRPIKYRGMLAVDDEIHAAQDSSDKIIAPSYVTVPGGKKVPQYAPTVVGTSLAYNPAGNCDGNFMSYKFQPNNNCYNYACNIATNSFAQPGRKHGHFLNFPPSGQDRVEGAVLDGLLLIGGVDVSLSQLKPLPGPGHPVALLISAGFNPKQTGWNGDYHWVRCDSASSWNTWSQKDGGDQVTNFDFAGKPITDPYESNWTVNQGPVAGTPDYPNDIVAGYDFYAWMYVPGEGVDII